MRGGGIGPRRQQGYDCRIITAVAVHAADGRPIDLRHQLVLPQAGLDQLEDARVHRLDDARGPAHVLDFPRRLDRTLPVHQRVGVHEARIGKVRPQRFHAGGAEVVVVHLDADRQPPPAPLLDQPGQVVHRVALGGLNVVVRVADDVIVVHEHGPLGPVRVLPPAVPDGRALLGQDHALMDVEGPAVIARQPGHIGGVRDDEQIDPLLLHRRSGAGDAIVIFRLVEVQGCLCHGRSDSERADAVRMWSLGAAGGQASPSPARKTGRAPF